ncbi:MAG TPA: adenylate/guanylate cyclase domain-containing protein [Pantanalinema sp.]
MSSLSRLVHALLNVNVTSSDGQSRRLRKVSVNATLVLGAACAAIWAIAFAGLGAWWLACVDLGMALLYAILLAGIHRFKRIEPFRSLALGMLLVASLAHHMILGGFAGSGSSILFAFLTPASALITYRAKDAWPWFVAFLGVLVLAALTDKRFAPLGHIDSQVVLSWTTAAAIASFTVMLFGFFRYFLIQREEILEALRVEQDKSERLLLNILPEEIAGRLKQQPGIIADGFPEVTVLFADLVGFTKLSEELSAQELVHLLDSIFTSFDHLTERHGLEKIKTIGDAYMVAGGLPQPRPDHAEAIARLALDMRDAITRSPLAQRHDLAMRIGIHTGPVVAGIIGDTKFSYDMWGDTVNTASRMESHGLPGEIQVSEDTYGRLSVAFELEGRGSVAVKGKGEMPVYLLQGMRSFTASEAPSLA